MKRFTIIVALVLLAAMPMFAERVTPETARKVATTFLNNNDAKTTQLTDLSKAAGFPNLYIFSTENSFVVMAADDCAKPILGYSLTNTFVVEGMPENISSWLLGYSDEIQWAIDNKQRATSEIAQQWKDLVVGKTDTAKTDAVVGPLIQTKWNQNSPYNNLCPTGTVTGCVATAMAQVMKYWNYPQQGQGSHSYIPQTHPEYGEQTANFSATTYDWANMTNTYGSTSNSIQKEAVATLMFHCGVSVDMDYRHSSEGGSGATSSEVPSALVEYFNYSPSATYLQKENYSEEQWIAFLKSELNEKRPLFYRGRHENGGHAFVCDGYDSDNYFHFNWGWGGSDGNGTNNGYWEIGALNPLSGGIGSGSGTYNLNNAVIAWIEPLSNLDSPNISATATNGAIVLNWDPIIDAISYNIYRDNVRIATNVIGNSFNDNDIAFGIYYEYYIRAVSEDTVSNPSNRVKLLYTYRDFSPSNLVVSYNESNATLNWANIEVPPFDIHYCIEPNYYAVGTHDYTNGTYWGQRFPSSMIAPFFEMGITKISSCFYFASNYSLYVFNGDLTEVDKIHEQSFTKTNTAVDWMDLDFIEPLSIDCSKDLWIVFYNNDENASDPALLGDYNDENASDVRHMSTSLETLSTETTSNETVSWLIRSYFSDGTYTYNIYDGETKLNDEAIAGTTYIHESPEANTIHNYTVKTNYYGGESAASNTASLALGSNTLTSLTLENKDNLTIGSGSILTVTGSLSNADEDNLILEDGAQLIHNTTGVKATVKKNITSYNEDGGWNFIASPISETFTPTEENGLLSGNYDLYFYDEPFHTWRNHKEHLVDGINQNAASNFNIEYKKGYLYANDTYTTLQFAGTLMPSNNSITINDLSHSATELNGFNLVGNPFACNATVDKDYYVVNESNVSLPEPGHVIAPCESVIVQASENNASVTFTKVSPQKEAKSTNCIDLVVMQNKNSIDRARVRFGDGENLEKFNMEGQHTQISFPYNGQDFAVIYADGENELPLKFKASENGTYTFSVETGNLDLVYLHLIDNLTGNDVDLLVAPNYTFEAKTTDYASRFRLVFSNCEDAVGDNATFAYINNGDIIINEDGTLQIVDMTGRVIYQGDAKHCVSTTGMAAGVYVLRLITADYVKTQKIVIE